MQSCCSYVMTSTKGYDCLLIPGASKTSLTNNGGLSMVFPEVCGTAGGVVTSTAATTICTQTTPFTLTFLSDLYEDGGAAGESSFPNGGFQLVYFQDSINCLNNN